MVTLRIYDSLKPVIAAVNGAAAGVGMTMLLPMDIRIASIDARFGLVFSRRGIVIEGASSYFLPRLMGMSSALEWAYSGRMFQAQEALERGLLRSLHAPDDLLPAANAIAHAIIDNAAPVSVALTRQMMWRMLAASHPMEAHRAESLALHARRPSADAREGVSSFLESARRIFPTRAARPPEHLAELGRSGVLGVRHRHWRSATWIARPIALMGAVYARACTHNCSSWRFACLM